MHAKNSQNGDISFETQSNKGTLIGVFLVVVAIAGFSILAKPIADNVSELETSILNTEAEITTIDAKIVEFQAAEEEFDLSTEVQRLESLKAIPLGINQDEVIRDVMEIAENYDIALNSISFGTGKTEIDAIYSLRVNASFEGNYNDLIDFLEGLEQNGRVFVVENISVQVSTLDISKIERASFSLTMEAYFQE
jgi:Tfp pilus assembly protein PilO